MLYDVVQFNVCLKTVIIDVVETERPVYWQRVSLILASCWVCYDVRNLLWWNSLEGIFL